jgi:hypothetical protein
MYARALHAFLLALTCLAPPHALLVAYWGADGATALSVNMRILPVLRIAPTPVASSPSASSSLSTTTTPSTTTHGHHHHPCSGEEDSVRSRSSFGQRGTTVVRAVACSHTHTATAQPRRAFCIRIDILTSSAKITRTWFIPKSLFVSFACLLSKKHNSPLV